ncbi:RAMP superfamily CRISPR-associated protein [Nocardiopsis nanhaiensis]
MTTGPVDAHGPRPDAVVWELTARLLLLTDAHVGAARATPRHAAESDVDLSLDRDPRTGVPRLRATTLAGLLRHELVARTADTAGVATLLGSDDARAATGTGVSAPSPSALDVDDAHATLPESAPVTVRVGTRVDPATGAVRPGRMWQWEVLPAGTVFTAHLRLHVAAPADEARLLTQFVLAARGFGGDGPGIRIGGSSGRGHGAVRATRWAAVRHDLTDEPEWFGYHSRDWESRWREGREALAASGATDLAALLDTGLREHGRTAIAAHLAARALSVDRRQRAELHLELNVAERAEPAPETPPPSDPSSLRPGLLLIGDVPEAGRLAEVDRAHRRRPTVSGNDDDQVEVRPVLGDAALFALLKRLGGRLVRDAAEHLRGAGASREAGAQRGSERDGECGHWRAWHDHWWGADTVHRPGAPPVPPVPARIRLRATPVLTGGAPLTTTRLTVDALFGDAVSGRLFTKDLHCGGSAEAVLDITEPDDAIRGLLALVVRELATVPLDTLGAGAGSGNGRLSATGAVLVTYKGTGEEPERVDLLSALRAPDGEAARTVRGWLAALHTRLTEADHGHGVEPETGSSEGYAAEPRAGGKARAEEDQT